MPESFLQMRLGFETECSGTPTPTEKMLLPILGPATLGQVSNCLSGLRRSAFLYYFSPPLQVNDDTLTHTVIQKVGKNMGKKPG